MTDCPPAVERQAVITIYMKKRVQKSASGIAFNMGQTRRAKRVPTSIAVKWGFAEVCAYAGTIINLTVLGCAVRNDEGVEVRPGQIIFIRFWMPDERILKIEVVHTKLEGVHGFGARFLDLTKDEKETLEEMVRLFGEPHRNKRPSRAK